MFPNVETMFRSDIETMKGFCALAQPEHLVMLKEVCTWLAAACLGSYVARMLCSKVPLLPTSLTYKDELTQHLEPMVTQQCTGLCFVTPS